MEPLVTSLIDSLFFPNHLQFKTPLGSSYSGISQELKMVLMLKALTVSKER